MIINKKGEKFYFEGVEYVIGGDVIGTEESAYSGLLGNIYEIRTYEDKETDNETPDLYCRFEAPITNYDIAKLEKTFSKLCGENKSLEEICIDSVIMSPQMVQPIQDKEYTVYILEEDWAANDDYGHDVEIFTDLNSAKRSMYEQLKKEMNEGCIPNFKNDDDYIEESDENSFECYIDGYYSESHYSLSITEKSMGISEQFMFKIVKDVLLEIIHLDMKDMLDNNVKFKTLSDKVHQQIIKDEDIPKIIMEEFRCDGDVSEVYYEIIDEIVDKFIKKYKK